MLETPRQKTFPPLSSRLAPVGHMEQYYAAKIEGFLVEYKHFTPDTPIAEIREFDRLVRTALSELRTLQYNRLADSTRLSLPKAA